MAHLKPNSIPILRFQHPNLQMNACPSTYTPSQPNHTTWLHLCLAGKTTTTRNSPRSSVTLYINNTMLFRQKCSERKYLCLLLCCVVVLNMEEVEGCSTPRGGEWRLPAVPRECPPPPRKKRKAKESTPPKNGYFRTPEIEVFFNTKCYISI